MSMEIKYHQELDFLFSLKRYTKLLETNDINSNERSIVWKEYFNHYDYLFTKNDLLTLFQSHHLLTFIAYYVESNSIESFLKLSADDLLTLLARSQHSSEKNREKLWELYKQFLDDEMYVEPFEYPIFQNAILDTERFRTRLFEAIHQAYTTFKHVLAREEKKIKSELSIHISRFNSGDDVYLRRLKKLDLYPENRLPENFRVYLLYFTTNRHLIFSDSDFLVFSVDLYQEIKDYFNDLNLDEFVSIISDKTRFKLLKLLLKKESYGAEMAEEMKMTTANISHHIDKINRLKLVNTRKGKNRRVYYSADKQLVSRYFEAIRMNLMDEEKD